MQYMEVYVRYMPHSPYRLTSQPARIVMGTVKDRRFVQDKIIEAFQGRCHDARQLDDNLVEVSTRKSLIEAADKVQRIIDENQNASYPKPANRNHLHYTT